MGSYNFLFFLKRDNKIYSSESCEQFLLNSVLVKCNESEIINLDVLISNCKTDYENDDVIIIFQS